MTEIESVVEFNKIYSTDILPNPDTGYTLTPLLLPSVVFDVRQGREMLPWLEQNNQILKDIVDAQDKSLSEKNVIIAQKDLIIQASEEVFEAANKRWEA